MASQDIIDYLKKKKEREEGVSIQELVREFKLSQGTVNQSVKKLRKYHEVEIKLEGRKQYLYFLETTACT